MINLLQEPINPWQIEEQIGGEGLPLGAIFFGMLLTLGPWGRVCPFVLFILQVGHFFVCPVERPDGKGATGSPWSLDLHRPDTLVERIFEHAFS